MKKSKLLVCTVFVLLSGCELKDDVDFHLYDAHRFIIHAVNNGMYIVASSTLAGEKSLNPEIEAFSNILARDHTQINIDMLEFAERKKINIADTFDSEKQVRLTTLSQLQGPSFSKRYISEMVSSHQLYVTKFDSASRFANDKQIREWAAQQLSTIQSHHQEAIRLESLID